MENKLNSLDEAILNISKTKEKDKYGDATQDDILYSRWKTRYAETIGAFYADFIKPRLPKLEVIREWNDMLIKYSKMPGAVFPIRGGYSNKDEMRRGWLVRVNGGVFSYTFTDNYFPAYIYKMALDGFCPEPDEFYEYMTGKSSKDATKLDGFVKEKDISWLKTLNDELRSKGKDENHIKNIFDINEDKERRFLKMPISYGQYSSSETVKNVYINTNPAPTCPLGDCGYKHAHVFAVRGEYEIDRDNVKEWEKINDKVSLGKESDYTWKDDIDNYAWDRTVESGEVDELRKIVVAHFLRLCNPINHFLSPKQGCNKFTEENGDYSLDIGEYNNLLSYIMFLREQEFAKDDVYKNFRISALVPERYKSEDRSTDIIHVVYHEKKQEATDRKNKEDKKKETVEKKAEKTKSEADKSISKAKSSGSAKNGSGRTAGSRDNSRYNFNGKKHYKSSLIVALVDKYLEDNPHADIAELNGAFDLTLLGKPIILLPKDITHSWESKVQKTERVLLDGTKIYINNQVQIGDMEAILNIANNLSYKVDLA